MKKCILCVSFVVLAFSVNAQSDYSLYLSQAWECVTAGKCDAAQRNYGVYRDLTGSRIPSLENAIIECQKSASATEVKSYHIGDDAEDFVGKEGYKIAYLDRNQKHGFAIGSGFTSDGWPTMEECELMYPNRFSLGLSGEYWTSERENFWGPIDYHTFDFSTHKKHGRNLKNKQIKTIYVIRF